MSLVALFMVSCEFVEGGVDKPNTPDDPNTEEPNTPDTPDEPDDPNNPEDPSEPENPEDPNTPEDPSDPGNPEEPAKPELVVKGGDVIPISAEGGNVEIKYEVLNPIEGVEVEATEDVDWIVDLVVAESVKFSVQSNEGEARTGAVTLTYGDLTASVTIMQTEILEEGIVRLTVTSNLTVAYDATGGAGEIIYLLECDDANALPTVKSDVDWVVVGDVETGKVDYTVAANVEEVARVGHIELSYEDELVEITIEQAAAYYEPILTVSRTSVTVNESVQFTVTYADKDVTAEALIKMYNTNEVVEANYTPTEAGEQTFVAEYNGRSSQPVTINVLPESLPGFPVDTAPSSYDFNQRMLIVDHTGAGCQYCPQVKQAIRDAEEDVNYKDKFNVVYSYSFRSTEVCYSPAAKTLWNYYVGVCSTGNKLTGYPSFTTNYRFNYTGRNNIKERIDEYWEKNPSASVALAAEMTDDKIIVNASVKSSKSQNIKISLWVLEDDIYEYQTNASADWMHTHHSVMRYALTNISASDIAGDDFGHVDANSTLSKTLEFSNTIPNIWNRDNMKLIVIISAPNSKYGGKYEVVTTMMCNFGESVGFDYKK